LRTIVNSHARSAISRSSARSAERARTKASWTTSSRVVVRAAEELAGEGHQTRRVAVVDGIEGAIVPLRTRSTSCSSVAVR
jgi:hypothetical protein